MKKALLILCSVVLLSACGQQAPTDGSLTNASTSQSNSTSMANNTKQPCTTNQMDKPGSEDPVVTMETTMGTVKIRLFPCEAPKTVENFTELAKKGFYDGLLFHRVIKDFMIQGGDPQGTGTGGETWNGQPIPDEFSTLSHVKGAVSMANRGPNTATSQFFIVQNASGYTSLDGGYTVFGQVVEGMDIVDKIANTATDKCAPGEVRLGCDKPKTDVVMKKVTVAKGL